MTLQLVLTTRDSTVYGLYRDGTELRGVYYAYPQVARAACQSTDACDYPILLGNDPFYGGLGGTFTQVSPPQHQAKEHVC